MRGPLVRSWTPLLAVIPVGSSLKSTTVAYKKDGFSQSRNFSIAFQPGAPSLYAVSRVDLSSTSEKFIHTSADNNLGEDRLKKAPIRQFRLGIRNSEWNNKFAKVAWDCSL